MNEMDWDSEELNRAYEEAGERIRLLDEWLKERIPIMVKESEALDDEPCALYDLVDQMYYDEREAEKYRHLLPEMTGQTYSILRAEWEMKNLTKELTDTKAILAQIQGIITGVLDPLTIPEIIAPQTRMTFMDATRYVHSKCDFRSESYCEKVVRKLEKSLDKKHVFMRDVLQLIDTLKDRENTRISAKTKKERGG